MKRSTEQGFALVLVLSLLGLLVLVVYALAALNRVDAQLSGTAVYQTQARQNALLGLSTATGELQRLLGGDNRQTGMAGISGVSAGASHPGRHWSGVWSNSGVTWLASGSVEPNNPGLTGVDSVVILATATLNTDATDREHVRVLRVPVMTTTPDGRTTRQGSMAYWVGDEGVKLSLVIPESAAAVSGGRHAINLQFPTLPPESAVLAKLLAYEQLALAGTTTVQRQGGFHSHGLTHYGLVALVPRAGLLNVNSSSARYWAGVGATYNRLRPPGAAPLGNVTAFGNQMAAPALWAGADADKAASGPFRSVSAFLSQARVINAITDNGATLIDFIQTMQPWLTTRSDTFRIRAYGESLNPSDPARIEATATCEAVVQRTPEALPGFGQRFVITYFRWLGPDDI